MRGRMLLGAVGIAAVVITAGVVGCGGGGGKTGATGAKLPSKAAPEVSDRSDQVAGPERRPAQLAHRDELDLGEPVKKLGVA